MTEEYIQKLCKQLKGFSLEEQQALIDEIRSHMESGEEDTKMGENIEQRRKRLMTEMGSPKELGANFKTIYRQNGLIDYLWIAIPFLLYPFLNMLYMKLMPVHPWADVRLDILIHFPLIAVGMWRRSAPLILFWAATLASQIMAMLLVTHGYYGTIQTTVWFVILLGLLVLLVYVLWQNRQEFLTFTFGLLPLLLGFTGSLMVMVQPQIPSPLGSFDRSLLHLFVSMTRSGDVLPFYGTLLSLALFFLATNRNLRWLGLGFYGLALGLGRDYVSLFAAEQGLLSPRIYTFFILVAPIIVFLGWLLEQSKNRQLRFAE